MRQFFYLGNNYCFGLSFRLTNKAASAEFAKSFKWMRKSVVDVCPKKDKRRL